MLHVTTLMADGSVTREALCTTVQAVPQSKRARTVSSMGGMTPATFTGDGNQVSAIFQGLSPTLFFNSLATSMLLL